MCEDQILAGYWSEPEVICTLNKLHVAYLLCICICLLVRSVTLHYYVNRIQVLFFLGVISSFLFCFIDGNFKLFPFKKKKKKRKNPLSLHLIDACTNLSLLV